SRSSSSRPAPCPPSPASPWPPSSAPSCRSGASSASTRRPPSAPAPDPGSPMSSPALHLEDVRKTYRSGDEEVVALDHATLEVGRDELVALVGPSGSGKTTLLSVAGVLLAPTEGRVRVGDTDVSDLSEKERTAF